jgi:uncharacterized protein (DUF1800 family)
MRRRAAVIAALALLGALAAREAAADSAQVLHALHRLTYGPRPGDVERVERMGLAAWLEQQLEPARIPDPATDETLTAFSTLTMSIGELHRDYPRNNGRVETPPPFLPPFAPADSMGESSAPDPGARISMPAARARRPVRMTAELQAARMLRAVRSERQVQEVMVDFWANHFNVFAGKVEVRWYATAWEREVLRPHALGRFPDLLKATARHPAMLYYLDNWLSARPDYPIRFGPSAGRKAGLNENYARELMELHTLGVDGGYTQKDVTEVARAFTGWTIDRYRGEARFVFRPAMHDAGAKVVLGQRLRWGGQQDGEDVLDMLARHPSTSRFLATKLVRRFVADDPPPALVERVAAVYRDTGGDIRAMLRSIVAAPEFAAAAGAKIKKPSEFVASAARGVGATVNARGALALARAAAEIGEGYYEAQAPTGYPDRAEAWVSPGTLLARMNFALALVDNRLPGVSVNTGALLTGVDRRQPGAVLEKLLAALLNGRASAATREVLGAQLGAPEITRLTLDDRGPADTDVAKLAALVLGSPEFQRR